MKLYTCLSVLLLSLGAFTAHAEDTSSQVGAPVISEISWMTELDEAKALAKEQNRPIFLYFTGSDWCPWCMKMNTQILSTPEFQQSLSTKMIFVKIDFPRKTKLDDATEKKRKALSKDFGVTGFPSIVLLDPNANRIDTLHFEQGGGANYAKKVHDLLDAYTKKSTS